MKRYTTLPLILCFLFLGCSELFNLNPQQERPHKWIQELKWMPDDETLLTTVSIPKSETEYDYRQYVYNTKGELISQAENKNLTNLYFCTDGTHAVTGYSPVVVREIATGNAIASYDDIIVYGQAYGTDEYLVGKNSIENPYRTYRIVKITTNGIEERSSMRVLSADRSDYYASPAFASHKRVITSELDSLNKACLVVRDSQMHLIHITPLPDSIPPNFIYNVYPHCSTNGDIVIYSENGNFGFISNITDGTIDATHDVSLDHEVVQLTSDGNTLYTVDKYGTAIISYNIAARTSTYITQSVDRKYPTRLTLSPDGKYLAYVLNEYSIDDELRIIQLP